MDYQNVRGTQDYVPKQEIFERTLEDIFKAEYNSECILIEQAIKQKLNGSQK